jgi:predicted NBD/HSP70 family sugar kinase
MKTANSQLVKLTNTNLVIEKLVELKETSRIELSRITTLNKATVSSIIQVLIDRSIVIELDKKIKTSGRSANAIALNKRAGRILSLDLQTNLIYGVVSNLFGEILFEVNKPIENPEFSFYLTSLLETIDELRSNTYDSIYGVIGIGIGVYGILSNSKKIVYAPFSSWKDIELKKIIEDYTGIKTYVENEANISALGENIVHANQKNLVSLNIGIGVGIGIIIDNKLYTGENGFAGEIGHTILIPNGKECVCGNHGCLEKYISDTAIIEKYQELTSEKVTITEFISRLKSKDKHAIEVYQEFIEYLSLTINNISQLLNPQTIVINSLIVENKPESISQIKNKLRSKIMRLEVLTTSSFKAKTNVLGLTHVLIQEFLEIENYKLKS